MRYSVGSTHEVQHVIQQGKGRYSVTLEPEFVSRLDDLARRGGVHRSRVIEELCEAQMGVVELGHAREDVEEAAERLVEVAIEFGEVAREALAVVDDLEGRLVRQQRRLEGRRC